MGVEYFLWLSPTDLPLYFKFYIVLGFTSVGFAFHLDVNYKFSYF